MFVLGTPIWMGHGRFRRLPSLGPIESRTAQTLMNLTTIAGREELSVLPRR